ncbi:MAG: hypothetical protein WCD21_21830, partial [Streptomyces sp.]
MLMEAHLPDRDATPVPAAHRLAEALRKATEDGAKAVRERRVPKWEAVRKALDEWDGEGVPDRVVRRGAGLLLSTLEEVSDALDTAPPPMLVDGSETATQTETVPQAEPGTPARTETAAPAEPPASTEPPARTDSGPQDPDQGPAAR